MNHFLKRLESTLLEILETNPSKDAPYHNNAHMTHMWSLSRLIWETEKEDTGLGDPDWDYVVLMFTSLLHDVVHSAGRLPDSHNVENARRFIADLIKRRGFTLPNHVVTAIDQAVACTEFPFIHVPTTKLQMVIRDADILYPAFVGDPKIVMEGLRLEASWRLGQVSYQAMYAGQLEFVKNAKLFTQTAQDIWDVKAPAYLECLKQYAERRGKNPCLNIKSAPTRSPGLPWTSSTSCTITVRSKSAICRVRSVSTNSVISAWLRRTSMTRVSACSPNWASSRRASTTPRKRSMSNK